MAKWISVNDALPEIGERVLILCKYGLLPTRYADFVEVGERTQYRDGVGWYGYGPQSELITHWMPLPEAPAVETELVQDVTGEFYTRATGNG